MGLASWNLTSSLVLIPRNFSSFCLRVTKEPSYDLLENGDGYTVGDEEVKFGLWAAKVLAVLSKTACSVFLGMGESNCAWNRKALLHRDTMLAAAAVYRGKRAGRPFHPCLAEERMPCHVYPLKLPVLFSFPVQISCPSFQNTDPVVWYSFSKQPLASSISFSALIFHVRHSRSPPRYPNIHFSLEDITFIEQIFFFLLPFFSDHNHYLSLQKCTEMRMVQYLPHIRSITW